MTDELPRPLTMNPPSFSGIPFRMKTDPAPARPLSTPLSSGAVPSDKGGDQGIDKDRGWHACFRGNGRLAVHPLWCPAPSRRKPGHRTARTGLWRRGSPRKAWSLPLSLAHLPRRDLEDLTSVRICLLANASCGITPPVTRKPHQSRSCLRNPFPHPACPVAGSSNSPPWAPAPPAR
jgi:hypothetical protein